MRAVDTPHVEPRVGPVLRACALSQVLVEVLRASNPQVEVIDRGSYLRISAPGALVLRRAAVEDALGQPFRLPGDLEFVMPSFAGRLVLSEERAEWHAS